MKKIIFFLLALTAGFYLYQQQSLENSLVVEPSPAPTETEYVQEEINTQLILTASENGQTALELLEANAEIKTKDYGDAGVFVTGIDDVESNNESYWAFYVNDEYAQQGVSQTILESGDIIKFIYEEINQEEL